MKYNYSEDDDTELEEKPFYPLFTGKDVKTDPSDESFDNDLHDGTNPNESETKNLQLRGVPSKAGKLANPFENTWNLARFKVLKNWEGVVDSIDEEHFIAKVKEVSDEGSLYTEQFEIGLDNVTEDDSELLTEGAIFYLTIGYLINPGGQRIKSTWLVFRRTPEWNHGEVVQIEKESLELFESLPPSEI